MLAVQSESCRYSLPLEKAIETKDLSPLFVCESSEGKELEINLCRQDCCHGSSGCLDETFTMPASVLQRGAATQPCQTPAQVADSLGQGAWRRNGGKDEWSSSICSLPTMLDLPSRKRRVLFVGDSTMLEIAAMTAYAAGSYRNGASLNCTCATSARDAGTEKECRIFDAVGAKLDVSMVWAGHSKCDGNRMGVRVVNQANWRNMLSQKVETMRPDIIVFHVPVLHSCDLLKACNRALERFLCFMLQFSSKQTDIMAINTAGGLTRSDCTVSKVRACPFKLRAYSKKIGFFMKRVAPSVPILDIFGPTESWQVRTAPQDPYQPPCVKMERHLTCDLTNVTNIQTALDNTTLISAPGRLIGVATMRTISLLSQNRNQNDRDQQFYENNCPVMWRTI